MFEQGHGSIAEHASATFYITGVSRAFTHELVRHRHLSFSQLSQRFVDESEANIVLPPASRKSKTEVVYDTEATYDDMRGTLREALEWWAKESAWHYDTIVDALQHEGLPNKQVREAARAVLPNMTETRIVVTGNLRAWKQVIDRRIADDVDREMQEVMGMVRDELAKHVSPVLFPEAKSNDINNYRRATMKAKLVDFYSYEYKTEFGMTVEPHFKFEYDDGHTEWVDGYHWSWGDLFLVDIDNPDDFAVWLADQELDGYIENYTKLDMLAYKYASDTEVE